MSAIHYRKIIRDAAVAGLTGLETTEARVYAGRTRPLEKGHKPSLLVYARSERASRAVRGMPPVLERNCTLHIEARVQTPTPPDDLLDQIAAEVETAIAAMTNYPAGTFLNGRASNLQFTSTEIIAEADSEQHIGGVRLEYLVTYHTVEGQPGAAA